MQKQQSSASPEFLRGASRLNTLRTAVSALGEAFSLHEGHQKARLYSEESAAKLRSVEELAIDALIREESAPTHSFTPVRDESVITPQTMPDDPLEREHYQLLRDARLAVMSAYAGKEN